MILLGTAGVTLAAAAAAFGCDGGRVRCGWLGERPVASSGALLWSFVIRPAVSPARRRRGLNQVAEAYDFMRVGACPVRDSLSSLVLRDPPVAPATETGTAAQRSLRSPVAHLAP